MSQCGNKFIFFEKKCLVNYYSSKIKIFNIKNMNNSYSFNQDQMNGIVEEIYSNIIKNCEKLKKETNCPNEQVVALLSVIASNFAPIIENKNN